jgi:hypothetical protein
MNPLTNDSRTFERTGLEFYGFWMTDSPFRPLINMLDDSSKSGICGPAPGT